MRRIILISSVLILLPAALLTQGQAQAPAAQTPRETPAAAAGTGRVAVVDFQKAVFENVEGKKAQEKLMGEVNKRQKDFEEKQKNLSDAQNKLQTQDKVLTDTAKADLSRQIEKLNTELQRMNDDAQKDLGDLQQQLGAVDLQKLDIVSSTFRVRPAVSFTSSLLRTSPRRLSGA